MTREQKRNILIIIIVVIVVWALLIFDARRKKEENQEGLYIKGQNFEYKYEPDEKDSDKPKRIKAPFVDIEYN